MRTKTRPADAAYRSIQPLILDIRPAAMATSQKNPVLSCLLGQQTYLESRLLNLQYLESRLDLSQQREVRSGQKTILFHLSLVRTQEPPISTECLRIDQD